LIAEAVAQGRADAVERPDLHPMGAIEAVIEALTERLENDNPRFDAERFRDACTAVPS
jgi:hypothetical protein